MEVKNYNNKIQQIIYTDIDGRLAEIHTGGYLEYKREFDESYDFKVPRRPLYIPFEVNDYCNMNCKMCWRSVEKNPNGKHMNMDMELLQKLVYDCRKVEMPSFFLGASSECLINPNIKDIIKLICEKGGGIDNVLITNGYALDEDICNLLIDYQWEKLFISLDAATPETYKKIRGKDLTIVEGNIERLLQLKKERNSELPFLRVSFVVMDENKDEMQKFIDKWKEKVDRIDFQTYESAEEAANVEKGLPDTGMRCSDPFRILQILCNGDVYPCASFFKKYHYLGNINDMTIDEIWHGEAINKLREEMISGNISDVCKSCMKQTNHIVEV